MVNVATKGELRNALSSNSNITLTADITVDYPWAVIDYNGNLDGNGHTITLEWTAEQKGSRFLNNLTGTISNTRFTGNYFTDSTTNRQAAICYAGVTDAFHHNKIENFVINGAPATGKSVALVAYISGVVWGIFHDNELTNVQFPNSGETFVVSSNQGSSTRNALHNCSIMKANNKETTLSHWFATSTRFYHTYAFGSKTGGQHLYYDINCNLPAGYVESTASGRLMNPVSITTLQNTMGYTSANGWEITDNVPHLIRFAHKDPEIVGDNLLSTNMMGMWSAENFSGTPTWNFGDGSSTETAAIVYHIYETSGTKTITATYGTESASFTVNVIAVTITGNNYFAVGVPYTATASASTSGGTWLWSDGTTGDTYTHTYTGAYIEYQPETIAVTYTYQGMEFTASLTLNALASVVTLNVDTDRINLTGYVTFDYALIGREPIANSILMESHDDGATWTESPYQSTYTFADTSRTVHLFKLKLTFTVQSPIYSNVVKITTRNSTYFNTQSNFKSGIEGDYDMLCISDIDFDYNYVAPNATNFRGVIDCQWHTFNIRFNRTSAAGFSLIGGIFGGEIKNAIITFTTYESGSTFPLIAYVGSTANIHHIRFQSCKTGSAKSTGEPIYFIAASGETLSEGALHDLEFKNCSIGTSSRVAYFGDDGGVTKSTRLIFNGCGSNGISSPYRTPTKVTNSIIIGGSHRNNVWNGSSDSSNVYYDSTAVLPTTFEPSDTNGRLLEITQESVEELGFTDANGWEFTNNVPTLKTTTKSITGKHTVAVNKPYTWTVSGNRYQCTWDFGDGSPTVTGANGNHTYTAAGDYTITCTDTDGSINYSVKVIGVTISGNNDFAPFVSYTATATPSVSGGTWLWNNGGTTDTYTNTFTGSYVDNEVETIRVTYTYDDESVTAYKEVHALVSTARLNCDRVSAPLNGTIEFTKVETGRDTKIGTTLLESHDEGVTWTETAYTGSYTFSDTTATTHEFKVKITFAVQQPVYSNSITITTVEGKIEIVAPSDGDKIFVGYPVIFMSVPSGLTNPTVEWNTGETGTSMSHTFTEAGSVTIEVEATSTEGVYTDTITVDVLPIADMEASAPQLFRNSIPVTYTVTSDNVGTYLWTFEDETTQTGASVTKTYTGYEKGDVVSAMVEGTFDDDVGNSYNKTDSVSSICAYPFSSYINARGEVFTFGSDTCRMLREGSSGFSEIQISTSVLSGHNFNVVNGLDTNNRQITFNVFVKGNYATMHAIRREMVHKMAPSKDLGTLSFVRDDGEIFTIPCNIALGYPKFVNEAELGGWVGTLSFIAPNGIWEGEQVTENANAVDNKGDVPCGFTATLTNNLINTTNNEQLTALSGTLSGVTVDTEKGTLTGGWSNVSLNSTLVQLEVGANSLTGCNTVTYKPKFLGV